MQRLEAGVWVDVTTGRCLPNSSFRLSVSVSLTAECTLRRYHPATQLYPAAYSNVFLLTVIR